MAEKGKRMGLELLDRPEDVLFMQPKKMINESQDVSFFLSSRAYSDLVTFLLQLNASMFPRISTTKTDYNSGLDSRTIMELRALLSKLTDLMDEAPPDPGPRRFGNVSFRKWLALAELNIDDLLAKHLPSHILAHGKWGDKSQSPALELRAYLLGSFGSAQRLDYGTGHELNFLAFLGSIWKLGGFVSISNEAVERAIVLGVFKPYLDLVRRLILTYNLEPAGSHGVWGLDDHSFIPYILGSAQLSPPVKDSQQLPVEGSAPGAPNPGEVANEENVGRFRSNNLYFGAVGFIYDVKKGPFWEHSPMLYDISGVTAGWAKINKGMIKMYMAEVLSKFPVIQHFTFGTIFKWERDPQAAAGDSFSVPNLNSSATSTDQNSQTRTTLHSDSLPVTATAAPWASNNASRILSGTISSKRIPVPTEKSSSGLPTHLPKQSPARASAMSRRVPSPSIQSQSSLDSLNAVKDSTPSVETLHSTRAPRVEDAST